MFRVLDLTQHLPGPYATQLLADRGATVWKVEPPGGDPTRHLDVLTPPDGVFEAVNRGKRSVVLDLKTDAGTEACLALAADADVVIEGFRPDVVDRLGVGYDAVSERNPEVVYCSVSGYGQTGPYRERAGHDLNFVGAGGLLDLTRSDADARPSVPGFSVADMAAGMAAAVSVTTALLERELGDGGGSYLDVSMLEAVLSFSQSVAPSALAGAEPRPGETAFTGTYPCYDVYEAADGRSLTVCAFEPHLWAALCDALDRSDLRDAHLADDPAVREATREALAERFAERPREAWLDALADVDTAVAPVATLGEALAGEQVAARNLVVGRGTGLPRVGFPALVDGERPAVDAPAPALGEHTAAVLREVGHGDALDVAGVGPE